MKLIKASGLGLRIQIYIFLLHHAWDSRGNDFSMHGYVMNAELKIQYDLKLWHKRKESLNIMQSLKKAEKFGYAFLYLYTILFSFSSKICCSFLLLKGFVSVSNC